MGELVAVRHGDVVVARRMWSKNVSVGDGVKVRRVLFDNAG